MKPDIIFEEENFLVVNKPPGLLTIPDRFTDAESMLNILRRKYENIFVVHRLDRDTGGCVCFAKNEETHRYLSELFTKREIEKYYLGIVHGVPSESEGIIEAPLAEHPVHKGQMQVNTRNGKASRTDYNVLEAFGKYSVLEFRIHTGRTHQIRVHCKHIGHPIVCDPLYGLTDPVFISSLKKNYHLSKTELDEKPILNRLALHALRLEFTSPDGKRVIVEAPPGRDMNALVKQCRKWLK